MSDVIYGDNKSPEVTGRKFDGQKIKSSGFRVVKLLSQYLDNFKKIWYKTFTLEGRIEKTKEDTNELQDKRKGLYDGINYLSQNEKVSDLTAIKEKELKKVEKKIYKLDLKQKNLLIALEKNNLKGEVTNLQAAIDSVIDNKKEEIKPEPIKQDESQKDIDQPHFAINNNFEQIQKDLDVNNASEEKEETDKKVEAVNNIPKEEPEVDNHVKTEEKEINQTPERPYSITDKRVGKDEFFQLQKEKEAALEEKETLKADDFSDDSLKNVFAELGQNMKELGNYVAKTKEDIDKRFNELSTKEKELDKKINLIEEKNNQIEEKERVLDKKAQLQEAENNNIANRNEELSVREEALTQKEDSLSKREENLTTEKAALEQSKQQINKYVADFKNIIQTTNEQLKPTEPGKEFTK